MTDYQLTFLVSLKLEAEQIVQYQDKIVEQLKGIGAEIKNISELKEQRLAYAIRGERKIWLANLVFSIEPEKAPEVEEMLSREQHVLRSMISRMPIEKEEVAPRRRPAQVQQAETEEIKPAESKEPADKAETSKNLDQKINEILDWE